MMKKIFLAFLALLSFLAAPAYGQSWQGPGLQPIIITGAHPIGNGSGDIQGGVAPALEDSGSPLSIEPPDIPDNFTLSDWTENSATRTVGAAEMKGRFACHVSHEAQEDPVLFPGQANKGHLHTFFGNTLAGRNSTYTSLRTTGWSTCAGGPTNRTAYWLPSVRKQLASGAWVTIKFDRITVYYVGNGGKDTRIPRDFKYISGFNPSDPGMTRLRNAILAANTAAGWTRYSFYSSITPINEKFDGFLGWYCDSTGAPPAVAGKGVPYLVNELGEDMFVKTYGAACTGSPSSPGRFSVKLHAPRCWDGKNLASPNGRDHVSHVIHDNNNGNDFCPDNWYWLPNFEGTFVYTHQGPSDYMTWAFSSDLMDYGAPDPGNWSKCRRISSNYCRGETGHFDWWGAWSYGTGGSFGPFLKILNECVGAKIVLDGVTTPGNGADCNDQTLGIGLRLKGNADAVPAACLADSTCPKHGPSNFVIWLSQPSLAADPTYPNYYFKLTPGANGALNASGSHGEHGGGGGGADMAMLEQPGGFMLAGKDEPDPTQLAAIDFDLKELAH